MNIPINPETRRPHPVQSVTALDSQAHGHNLPVATTLPIGVLAVGIAGYVGILGAFWIAFGSDSETAFALSIVSFFGLMYFGVPYLLVRTATAHGASKPRAQSISSFLTGDFDTLTGRISGWSAFLQFAFLPLALALGALAIGIIMMYLS